MGTIKTVNIMWGLPGSRKSHYIQNEIRNFHSIPGKRMHMIFALDDSGNIEYTIYVDVLCWTYKHVKSYTSV